MTTFTSPVSAGSVVVPADPLRSAVSAYLARFKGVSREHTCSDLQVFVTWCVERGVQPLSAERSDLELFVRWMQETRRFKPRRSHGGPRWWPVSGCRGCIRTCCAKFYADLLADHAETLGEPYSRHLGGEVRELRFHLRRQQMRITYWLGPDRRVILLTAFSKTQRSEVAEVHRALMVQKECEAQHGHAEDVYDREISDE